MLKGGLLNINDRYKNEICPQRVFAAYRMAPGKPNSRRYNLDEKKNAQQQQQPKVNLRTSGLS